MNRTKKDQGQWPPSLEVPLVEVIDLSSDSGEDAPRSEVEHNAQIRDALEQEEGEDDESDEWSMYEDLLNIEDQDEGSIYKCKQ